MENIKQMTCTPQSPYLRTTLQGLFFSVKIKVTLFLHGYILFFSGALLCFFFLWRVKNSLGKKKPSQPNPQNRRCWTCRFCMYQVNKYSFPDKFYVKHHETSFCFFAQLKRNIGKRYRVLKHKYRVMIKGYHKQNHNGFLTTIIFCRYDFFCWSGGVCQKNALREREGGLWCRGTRGEEREVTCARGVGLSKNASRER